ncbi:uncharacterized protein LOC143044557 [Mytilus galloprovincialis]|uniref:uncharacterized protein LOC143044557 n=1 Tax=Mytilus galloprovincialis TaxID=29158 RepID=UPI003F7BC400
MNYTNAIICICFATLLMVQHGSSSTDSAAEPTTTSTITEPTTTSTTTESTTTSTTTVPTTTLATTEPTTTLATTPTTAATGTTSASDSDDSGSTSLDVSFYQIVLCVCISIASSKRTCVLPTGVFS